MKILIACEYSGVVRDAFLARGHDAMSCDLLPTDVPGPHYEGDVFDVIDDGWDMMIAHPTCKYLTNSSSKHLYKMDGKGKSLFDAEGNKIPDNTRWARMRIGSLFFKELWEWDIEMIAVENPIMLGYAKELIGCGDQDQIVQPWWFGHPEKKATCLWLKNLPPLVETHNVYNEMMRLPKKEAQKCHMTSPGPDRWKSRSTTLTGVGAAMAARWG